MTNISCDDIFDETSIYSKDPLVIAKTFFNVIKDRDFVETLKMIVINRGMGGEYASIHFSEELSEVEMDEFDQPFEGVCFIALDEEIVTSHEVFYDLAEEAAQRFAKLNPHKSQEVKEFLKDLPELKKKHLESFSSKTHF